MDRVLVGRPVCKQPFLLANRRRLCPVSSHPFPPSTQHLKKSYLHNIESGTKKDGFFFSSFHFASLCGYELCFPTSWLFPLGAQCHDRESERFRYRTGKFLTSDDIPKRYPFVKGKSLVCDWTVSLLPLPQIDLFFLG